MPWVDLHRCGTGLIASLVLAGAATAVWARAPEPSHASAPASAATDHSQVEEHVFTLVQAGKCGQAKAAADRGDDHQLAAQIEQMCGLKPSSSSPASARGRQGGGGHGGRSGGGRQGDP